MIKIGTLITLPSSMKNCQIEVWCFGISKRYWLCSTISKKKKEVTAKTANLHSCWDVGNAITLMLINGEWQTIGNVNFRSRINR